MNDEPRPPTDADPDDDVTVAGDDEIIAALRPHATRAAAERPPSGDAADGDETDDDLTIDADADVIAEIRAASGASQPMDAAARPADDATIAEPPATPPVPPPPGAPLPLPAPATPVPFPPHAPALPTPAPPTTGPSTRWQPRGRLPVAQRTDRSDAAATPSRRGGLLVALGLVLVAAIVGIVVLLTGGDGDDDPAPTSSVVGSAVTPTGVGEPATSPGPSGP